MNDRRGIVPLLLVIVGTLAMVLSFPAGISAALDGSGAGALLYQVIFLVGMILVLASLIVAVVNLVRGNARVLAAITIAIAFVPLIAVVVVAVTARG